MGLSKFHDTFQYVLWRVGLAMHCHQRPDRSFFIGGRQVPICARCLGILIGSALVPLYCHDLFLATVFITAMMLDGATQALHLRESRNWLRLITGVGFAVGCGGLIGRIVTEIWNI